jgi:hypothetical protein
MPRSGQDTDVGNPTACAGCATPLRAGVVACPSCGVPVGRRLWTLDTATAWVTAVRWRDGVRVVKRLRDLDDERNCTRLAREADLLAALAGRLPPQTVPEFAAASRGVLVTSLVAGANMQDAMRRRGGGFSRPLAAAGRTVAALQAVDWTALSLRPERGGLIPDLGTVEYLFPAWALQAAVRAGNEEPVRPVLVHGDCVPSNWLWDGKRICLVDFGQFRIGSSEFDTALAWARLRLFGGGLRPAAGRRLSAAVLAPPWPASGTAWRANALVIIAWYDLLRFRTAPAGVRQLRRVALRTAVRNATQQLLAEHDLGSATHLGGA